MILNDEQKQAVDFNGGNLLITAGPGTGKTRTLTARVRHLLKTLPENKKILVITFTNKASGELRDRLATAGISLERQVESGTFHSFALSLLRRYAVRLKFSLGFTVAAPDEIEALAAAFWPEATAGECRERLLKVSRWKSSLAEDCHDEQVAGFRRFLREKERVDFDDILRDAVFLLRQEEDIRQELQGEYAHICVDEYQDVSLAQEELLKCLYGEGVHLTVIGDPDQSIYGFRGARAELLTRFPETFSPCTQMRLSTNYRSAVRIVTAAGEVIRQGRRSKNTVDVRAFSSKEGAVIVCEGASAWQEAHYIVRAVKALTGAGSLSEASSASGSEIAFMDIAVLFRLNTQADLLVKAFVEAGLPCRVYGAKAEPGGPEDLYEPRAEKVSLMTLHASKGLEFGVVFIAGCEEGLLPMHLAAFESDVEEERRLFYVGMTRAKERLVLLSARSRRLWGESLELKVSPFVADIPFSLKEIDKLPAEKHRKIEARSQMKLFG